MNLPGQLRLTTLGDLLGVLHRAGASGILELVEDRGASAGRKHRIFLDSGLVDQVESGLGAPLLGEILTRSGVLAREALGLLARRVLEKPDQRTGEILVSERLATPEHVAFGLRRQLRFRLDALYRLPDALIRFHVRAPSRPGTAPPRPLSPLEFLHGRPRTRHRARASSARPGAQGPSIDEAYRALGLAPGADARDIKQAFRRLAAESHPDRHPQASSDEKAQLLRRFALLSAAYHALIR